jgi:hypothetical protein
LGGGKKLLSFLQFSEVRKEEQHGWFIKEELLVKMTEIKLECYATEVLERYSKVNQPD